MLSLIAVIGKNRELGKDNKLLWHVPGDLARFKAITMGHPVIMGRKTYESLGKPLSGRTNIVVSHSTIALDQAIELAKRSPGADEIFIIGGGSLYEQTIGMADRLYLTLVDKTAPDADTFFPNYSRFTNVVSTETRQAGPFTVSYVVLTP